MIKVENVDVIGWEHAIRGMRNPMNSWDKSDSTFRKYDKVNIGSNDLDLMKKLVAAGTDHRKFMRMITVYMDITAPLYWWKEFDTYKVGTVRNSCSTMHKLLSKPFEVDDFSFDKMLLNSSAVDIATEIINKLNRLRECYLNCDNEESKKALWYTIIQLLPSSYNQRATVMLNYEVLANIYHGRQYHKLDEWRKFCDCIKCLPYSELIIGFSEVKS